MQKLTSVYNPGDSCIYSTGNAIILGSVVEKILGLSFQDYVKKNIIEPLNLVNTCFTSYWTLNDIQRKYAIGYKKDIHGINRCNYDYEKGFIPLSAGGAWSSVSDLYKFDKAIFSSTIH